MFIYNINSLNSPQNKQFLGQIV